MIAHKSTPKVWSPICWINGHLLYTPLFTIRDGELEEWINPFFDYGVVTMQVDETDNGDVRCRDCDKPAIMQCDVCEDYFCRDCMEHLEIRA